MNEMMASPSVGIVARKDLRLMMIGAHPDDADNIAGGLAVKLAADGARVRMLSVCNGDKGHHAMSSPDLAARRADEMRVSAERMGVEEYVTMGVPDCEIEPSVALRAQLTRRIRAFAPHVIVTHRACDYHADHRAVANLVMDAGYMLGVPLWCPDSPIPPVKPAILYMTDEFTDPRPLRPDILVPVDDAMPRLLDALRAHESQFFEWLPFDMGIPAAQVPDKADVAASADFIDRWWCEIKRRDARRFDAELRARLGDVPMPVNVEAYEMSEYGRTLSQAEIDAYFRWPC